MEVVLVIHVQHSNTTIDRRSFPPIFALGFFGCYSHILSNMMQLLLQTEYLVEAWEVAMYLRQSSPFSASGLTQAPV